MSLALIGRISPLSFGCRHVSNLDIYFTFGVCGSVIILTCCSTAILFGRFSIRKVNQALISTIEVMAPGCATLCFIFLVKYFWILRSNVRQITLSQTQKLYRNIATGRNYLLTDTWILCRRRLSFVYQNEWRYCVTNYFLRSVLIFASH